MRQEIRHFEIATRGPGAVACTEPVVDWVRSTGIQTGLLTLHLRHTSASLLIQENADPEVMHDLERFFQRLAPPGDPLFRHTAEGPDDMPAHIRAALTPTTLSIPVQNGQPVLGTWQGIFLYEHRKRPHRRVLMAHLLGE